MDFWKEINGKMFSFRCNQSLMSYYCIRFIGSLSFFYRTKLTKNKAEKFKKCHNKNFKTIMQDAIGITVMPVWWFKIPPARSCDVTCIKFSRKWMSKELSAVPKSTRVDLVDPYLLGMLRRYLSRKWNLRVLLLKILHRLYLNFWKNYTMSFFL